MCIRDRWKASQPLLDRIRMVWIPIAFVSPKSAPQGALLLATSDPQAGMDLHESRMSAGQGGLEVQGQPAADLVAKIKANTELLQSLGVDSVPDPRTLVVTITQSGETADTLAALKHARSLGMTHTLTICNAVSYTHLDVYKRQTSSCSTPHASRWR